jgi:hypothetical protein
MGRASREKRLRRQQITAAQQVLAERVQQARPGEKCKVVQRRAGRKVSETLLEVAEPWVDQVDTNDQRKKVISMVALAWNRSLLPDSEHGTGKGAEIAAQLGPSGMEILNEMIARKRALFPDETRAIVAFEVAGDGDKMRLNVVASLSPEEIADQERNGRKPGTAT